jgi:Mechanosensitive ion channel, conserved TM helix
MKELWKNAFVEPLEEFLKEVGSFLPHLLAMVVIIIVGLLSAWVVNFLIFRLLKTVKFDQVCGRTGFAQALSKGGVRETPSNFISRMIYWAILLVFLMFGLGALELKAVDQFVSQAFAYLPHLLVAITILIVGFILGNFFGRATLIAAVNAQMVQARFLARGVRLAVILFALAMAFEQMGIATAIIVAAFSIAFGGVVLALAIAFGLGAKDAAKEFIEKRLRKEQEPKEEDFSHL